MAVLLETTLGDVVIDLFTEERPKSKKWYNLHPTAAHSVNRCRLSEPRGAAAL